MKDRVFRSYPSAVLTARIRAMNVSGPLLMLLVTIGFELLRPITAVELYPAPIMVLVIVYAALSGGLLSGLISAVLAVLYSFRYFSEPGTFLEYDAQSLQQLISNIVVMPVAAFLVGMLKLRADRLTLSALRASEDRFQATFEQVAVGIAHVARDGRLLRVNQRLCEMIGYSRAELLQRRLPQLSSAAAAPDAGADAAFAPADAAESTSREQRWLRQDGSSVWLSVTLSAVRRPDGTPEYYIAVITDITSLKRVEDALRASEHRYRRLFDSNPEAMWVYDRATLRFLEVNDTAVARYGYSRAEFGSLTVRELLLPDGVSQLEQAAGLLAGIARHRSRDGSSMLVDVVSHAIEFDGRDAVLVLATDMTARKEAEQALAAEKERLAVTLRSIGDGVITTDTRGCVVLLNPAAESLTGWSQAEAAERSIDVVFPVVDEQTRQRLDSPISRVLQEGQAVAPARPLALLHRNGSSRLITDSGAPIRDRDGQVVGAVLVFRDITNQTRLERQLQQAQRMESIGVLAGGIAHDFNNLLTGIIGTADLALLDLPKAHPLWQDLDNIKRQGQRGAALTKQLLAFSRRQVLEPRLVDLNAAIGEVEHFIQRAIGTEIALEFHPAPDLAAVWVDPLQIEQVLLNLCINARDAMPEGGRLVLETANVELDATHAPQELAARPGAYVQIALTDTGHGIDRETLPHIFEPFFTTKELGKGTGLGLAMVYGIITQHNGVISVDSIPERGTRFTIWLPAVAAQSAEAAQLPARGSETILVVEDSAAVRDLIVRALESHGYTTLTAASGTAALRAFEQRRAAIELVVLASHPEPISADPLVARIGATAPAPQVLVIGDVGDAATSLPDGVSLLAQPFEPAELVARVRALLDAAPRRQAAPERQRSAGAPL